MTEFFHDIAQPQNVLLRSALLAGLLASVSCGVIGTYVVTRRITYIAGGIAHCVLGGMGAARYAQTVLGWDWAEPLLGAVLAALAAAAIIGVISLRAKEREDTVIGAVWAIGMAVGILFIARTPGYNTDLMSYLFGNITLVSKSNLWLLAELDIVVVAAGLAFYNQFQAVCFDEEFARLRGLRVEAYYLALLGLTAVTVVLLVYVVGIVMVIALLTLPAAIAGRMLGRMWQVMLLASVLCMLFTTGGLAVSYGPELPAGATTIALAGAAYVVLLIIPRRRRLSAQGRKRAQGTV